MAEVELPLIPLTEADAEDDSRHELEDIQSILGVEECVRYYPPNLAEVPDPAAVFAPDPALPPGREIDLFVDVPYCGTICGFCPFNVYPYEESEANAYLTALGQEVAILAGLYDLRSTRLRTVWIGGGTPSTLDEAALERLMGMLAGHFDLAAATEVTVEIKPQLKDLTEAKFAVLRDHGVTRISMGVQSVHPHQLRTLGRGHTAEEAYQVIDLVRGLGFPVNVDMIYRLPGETLAEVEADLDAMRGRGIEHMSWFPYVPHEGTSLARRIDRGRVARPGTRAEYFAMYSAVRERLAASGYHGYTPYHFGLDGRPCEYHVDRWRMPQRETLGIGPGAFSFFNGHIYANEHSPARYAAAVAAGRAPVQKAKRLTETERITRLAVLGVKFLSLDMDEFHRVSGVRMEEYYAEELALLERAGLVVRREGRLECTLAGEAFNNDIATILSTDTAARTRHPQAIDLMRS
ncbi:radical SAM protein [Streptomyces sp. 3MP-14]|uniref:Heme chaperone HemW n=1 Tax=Streptomyces mimosae TaxID=2586635 RepID=A0A5N5ZSJ1_9ACTN|nr:MULTISPECIES: coproporphyrinogen-III oxidase family protein [Streptomyces]KAB8158823.1 radical SAM protein [Streptomyces mimosae]KAB8172725.1 radical SAM protein [Streptomyces sp. 3MP-14]